MFPSCFQQNLLMLSKISKIENPRWAKKDEKQQESSKKTSCPKKNTYACHLWPPELRGGSGWKIIKRNTSFVLAFFFFFAKFAANSHHCKSFMAGNYQETNCTQEFMENFCKILFISKSVFGKENRCERNTFRN